MIKEKIKKLIASGIYDPIEIFNILYPTYDGHYSVLRREIHEVKNT